MSRQFLLLPSVLAAVALTVAGCSQPTSESSSSKAEATPKASGSTAESTPKPSSPTVESSPEPSSSVVFEVTPDHPTVKLDPASVQLSGAPVVTFYKDAAGYDYAIWLHNGPAGAKLTCANYAEEIDKSPVSVIVSGKSPAVAKDLKTLTDTRGEIHVTKPGQPFVRSGGMRGFVVTFTKTSDAAMSGTVALPEASAAAKSLTGEFNNAIVCEEK
ncbi:hypothetical protein SAMN02745121_05242 [Nannocystis exedens]|uniref:Lipoprotein n=1 Tax=Nannocystis exedens TaxID=54 RepID=A0A1I2CTH8_9BACT|nr:hypothetical protein [Nannocystis exedens]PCC68539.1 hypothetical protein NAEX_01555 [Nannocystis exedens]SFE71472.1 hypothetical protein SAMN02745121_05242 [Nannocystis exedens]